jgi:hypothetical protein
MDGGEKYAKRAREKENKEMGDEETTWSLGGEQRTDERCAYGPSNRDSWSIRTVILVWPRIVRQYGRAMGSQTSKESRRNGIFDLSWRSRDDSEVAILFRSDLRSL